MKLHVFFIVGFALSVTSMPIIAQDDMVIDNSIVLKLAMKEKPQSSVLSLSPSAKPNQSEVRGEAEQAEAIEEAGIEKTKKTDEDNVVEETEFSPMTYIGDSEIITAKFEDTLLELGRTYNLGYVEIVAANPGIDPWLPGEGTKITLPKRHLLPDAVHEGLVINLAEMRMYDFSSDPQNPKTYPLGIGRDGLNTPTGETSVKWKKEGPSWRPTARMKKENPELPDVVPPGEENPLGTHALYLGWPQYLIHGTHKPLGVGRRVSSGCIRMYPEDIIKVYGDIPSGTKVTVVKQPIKFAWIDGMLYMEAHAEDDLADEIEDNGVVKEYRVPETLFDDVTDVAGSKTDRLNWTAIREIVKRRHGVPVAILNADPSDDIELSKDLLAESKEDAKEKKASVVVRSQQFND